MRTVIASSLVLLVACGGGSQKPAESAAEETASAEPASSSSPDMPASPDTSAAPAAAAPAASAAPSDSSAPAPVASGPSVTGAIDGKPFEPKLARVTAKMAKDGRVVVTLLEHGDCKSAPKAGDAMLTMMVPWNAGEKADLSALKVQGKKGPGEISFVRIGKGNKKEVSPTFKPSGTVTIVSAPQTANSTGKVKLDLQSGEYMLNGDLDVQVCVAPK
jgi:hypothetical protein